MPVKPPVSRMIDIERAPMKEIRWNVWATLKGGTTQPEEGAAQEHAEAPHRAQRAERDLSEPLEEVQEHHVNRRAGAGDGYVTGGAGATLPAPRAGSSGHRGGT